jgi:L-histidine N-alpha-methyltransferase
MITQGLCAPQKHIPSLFFYDKEGSRLFEEITALPEYYPARTEKSILQDAAPQLGLRLKNVDVVEIGSGDCSKISILLNAVSAAHMETIRYVPFDVSHEAVTQSAEILQGCFADLEVHGVVADFLTQIDCIPHGTRRVFCFFGGTIGNLSRSQAAEFLAGLSGVMHPGDTLLLGVDMVKPEAVLERAYNDARGVTAAFNKNILHVVNEVAGCDFDPAAFLHRAFYAPAHQRIEMHLQARRDVQIHCPHRTQPFVMQTGETIHTENSHKYTRAGVQELVADAGLGIEHIFTDARHWFSLVQCVKP